MVLEHIETTHQAHIKYNFEEADGKNQSDAKDIMKDMDYSSLSSIIQSIGNWRLKVAKNPLNLVNIDNTREIVEKYSNGDVTNELAEILASYEHLPTSEGKTREYLNTFMIILTCSRNRRYKHEE